MKKTVLTGIMFVMTSGAQAYQVEAEVIGGYYDTKLTNGKLTNDNFNAGAQGTYYFQNIDTSKGPLAEAAFLNQASSVTIGYNYGKLSANIDESNRFKNLEKQYVNQYGKNEINEIKEALDKVRISRGLDENYQGKVDVEQQGLGVKAEGYLPVNNIPLYGSVSYNHSKVKAKNQFTALNVQGDDSGDRYALEVGAVIMPNLLVALGYTHIAGHESIDTFNVLNNGFIAGAIEARTIDKKKDAYTARMKYVGPVQGTDMFFGFETGILRGDSTQYNLKSDLYLTPKVGVGISYANSSFDSGTIPNSAYGVNASYFVTQNIEFKAGFVHAQGDNGAKNAKLGTLSATFRF